MDKRELAPKLRPDTNNASINLNRQIKKTGPGKSKYKSPQAYNA
jgi:hypothetical protein